VAAANKTEEQRSGRQALAPAAQALATSDPDRGVRSNSTLGFHPGLFLALKDQRSYSAMGSASNKATAD
jgi:hypothetical protein